MSNWCVHVRSILRKVRKSDLRPGPAETRMRPHRCEKKGGRDEVYFLETSLQSKGFKV